MKHYFSKNGILATLVLFSLPALAFAQNETRRERKERQEQIEKAEKDERRNTQQIIITRKGDKEDKTVIEIKGDKVLINGKDASKMGDVTVNLHNLGDIRSLRLNGASGDHDFNFDFNNDLNRDLNIDLNSRLNDDRVSLFSEDSNRAMLGVTTDEDDKGARITAVSKESAAAKAGLKTGDVITMIENDEIEDADDVSKAVRKHKPGDKVTVTVLRDNKQKNITAELGKWKGVRINSLNATLAPMEPFREFNYNDGNPQQGLGGMNFNFNGNNRPKLGLSVQDTDDGNGVKVLSVAGDSNAAKAGVKEGDVITHINGDEVNTTDDVLQTLQSVRNDPKMTFKIRRDGKEQTIEVNTPRNLKTADL